MAITQDSTPPEDRHLIVVANRLPLEYVSDGGGGTWRRAPGGLVSALEPALAGRPATWIGWSGHAGDTTGPALPNDLDGLRIVGIPLNPDQAELFYEGFANGASGPSITTS